MFLAEFDFEKWSELVFYIILVGGAVFGTVSKKLIEAFGGKKGDEKKEGLESLRKVATPQAPQARPAHPVAKPAGPVRPIAKPAVAVAKPVTPRPSFSKPIASMPSASAPRPPSPQPVKRDVPRAAPVQANRVARKPPPRSRLQPEHVPGRMDHLQPTVEDHYERKQTRTEMRAAQVDAVVEQHVGHLETRVAPAVVTGQILGEAAPIGQLNRSELRRAIVLREVFSPPIALRTETDPW